MSALTDKISEMRALQDEIEVLDTQIKALRRDHDYLRLSEIPALMAESNDARSISGAFGRATITSDMHVQAPDKAALHMWLQETGNGALIVPTVNGQTLKAFCREQIANGVELPGDILKVSPFVRVVLYRS